MPGSAWRRPSLGYMPAAHFQWDQSRTPPDRTTRREIRDGTPPQAARGSTGILPADTRRRVMPSRQTDGRGGQPGTGPATAPSAPATPEVYTARLGAGRRSIRRRRVVCRGRRGVRRRRVCRRRGICRRWGICRWRVVCRRRVIRRRGVIHRRRGVVDGWGCIEIRRPNKDATIPSATAVPAASTVPAATATIPSTTAAAVPASATTTATVPIRVSRGGRHQRQCQCTSQAYDTKRRINDRTHGVSLLWNSPHHRPQSRQQYVADIADGDGARPA